MRTNGNRSYTDKHYRKERGMTISEDNRIRVYKEYVGYWSIECDGVLIGHYKCKIFYALATAEQYLRTGDKTLVPEISRQPTYLPPVERERVWPASNVIKSRLSVDEDNAGHIKNVTVTEFSANSENYVVDVNYAEYTLGIYFRDNHEKLYEAHNQKAMALAKEVQAKHGTAGYEEWLVTIIAGDED
jgi:hypothetical protein